MSLSDPFAAKRQADARGVLRQALPARRLDRRHRHLQAHHVGRRARHRPRARGYSLTMRRGLPEPGADNHLIMAGHEAMLAQWFHRPLKRSDIELAQRVVREALRHEGVPRANSGTRSSRSNPARTSRCRSTSGASPAGRRSCRACRACFRGPGGLVSYLEPAMCRYFAPVIQATKARLMKLATPRDAEFGLRSAPVEVCNLILLLARYVGGAAAANRSSPRTTPPSSSIPSCSSRSAPSATR